MSQINISGLCSKLAGMVITRSRLVALAMAVIFASVAVQPAHAQSSDTWKSVAIIGGSTAAGAYIGHKVAGRTGAVVGAGIGATAGYAIDRRRRANQYRNQGYYDPNGGYYDPNGGYYDPNGGYYGNDGYYGNGGYYGGPSAYPGSLQSRQSYSHRSSR